MNTTVGKDIEIAANWLRQGDVVAIPTETVYGLAGNACSETAVQKIFSTKQRPLHNPLILHVDSLEKAATFCESIPPVLQELAKSFWPGPLTLLLPKKAGVLPDILNNGLPEIAVRVPNHPLTLSLLKLLDFPLAAPSANPFGYISPTTANHVLNQLGGKIPYILDGGPCTRGIESTIVRANGDEVVVLRPGAIPAETILQAVEKVSFHQQEKKAPVVAPGMLASHYAPRTKLILVDDASSFRPELWDSQVGYLVFRKEVKGYPGSPQVVLSPSGDLEEAAANLYSALHELDNLGLTLIVAERMPAHGLGISINDRLTRAAH